jgi:hypothetical protein
MLNNSIALNPKSEALSSADFKKSPENKQLLDLHGQEQQTARYNPLSSFVEFKEFVAEIVAERVEKQQQRREAERALERQERLKSIKQAYEWKIKKTENLRLAYAMLANKKDKIQLVPDFEQKPFLEAVNENLNPVELWLLTDKVQELNESLEQRIEEITSGDNGDLYSQFHQYDEKFETVTCGYNGEAETSYGAYMPTAELAEMETENEILFNLYLELVELTPLEPNREEIDTIRQALTA